MLTELVERTAELRELGPYVERARSVLASYERDFTFVNISLLDAADSWLPFREVARAREARWVRRDGAQVWLAPLQHAYEEAPFGVLALGLVDADWDASLLALIARQLGNGLVDAQRSREYAQDELRRTLFHQSPVAICVCGGPEHRYLLANPSYMAMVNKCDLIGRTVTEVWPEIVGTPLLAVFDHVYGTGEPYVTEEFVTHLDRDGDGVAEECFFRFNLVATRDGSGEITGWTCTAADISAQVRARREAEQANRAKDDFLAMLGHELRNPLAPITTSLYLMEKHGNDRFLPERATIQRQVDHLVRLVDDLLDVSRVLGGKMRLQKRPVELSDCVYRAVELASSLLLERKQQLRLLVPERGLTVLGDIDRLTQVVTNLLTNAAKYSPDGSQITIDAQSEGAHVRLTVRDLGMGISAEMLPQVFERFTQERQALDRSRGGLGIGLAIVNGIVQAHEGRVRAHSAGIGLGSAFEVELPLASAAQLAALMDKPRGRPAPAPQPRIHARVLVVDDNRDAAHTLARVLGDLEQEAEVAYDGEMALRVARRLEPTLALLDIGLPGMDGYTLAGHLRTQLPRRVRLVAVTGYGQPCDRDRAFAAGFDAHVVKPLRIDAVESILEDLQAEAESA